MPDKFTELSRELHRYAVEHSGGRDELMLELAAETEREAGDSAVMMTAPEQGAMMTALCRALNARRALEIGTFTGFGSISIARGLVEGGLLVTCDVSEQWTAIATRYFERAGLADRIDLRLGPALETLRELPVSEPFDFAFIDADKTEYPAYYEGCLRLLRPGGLLMLDNVFLGGDVIDAAVDRDAAVVMRELNDRVAADGRVLCSMLPVADGIMLAVKLG